MVSFFVLFHSSILFSLISGETIDFLVLQPIYNSYDDSLSDSQSGYYQNDGPKWLMLNSSNLTRAQLPTIQTCGSNVGTQLHIFEYIDDDNTSYPERNAILFSNRSMFGCPDNDFPDVSFAELSSFNSSRIYVVKLTLTGYEGAFWIMNVMWNGSIPLTGEFRCGQVQDKDDIVNKPKVYKLYLPASGEAHIEHDDIAVVNLSVSADITDPSDIAIKLYDASFYELSTRALPVRHWVYDAVVGVEYKFNVQVMAGAWVYAQIYDHRYFANSIINHIEAHIHYGCDGKPYLPAFPSAPSSSSTLSPSSPPSSASAPFPSTDQQNSNNAPAPLPWWVFLIIGIVALALVTAGGFVYCRRSSSKQKQSLVEPLVQSD